ncbi:tRNA (guanosine(46)-N7)-methyltransferase TrmB, partial [Acinetobacter baumannii]|nr:tRNA (guanosine(46)-N7)-methyltransferase TrmB [Acinetobacter baumannii]
VLRAGAGLTDSFSEGEIDGLVLNFSDPWPKTPHEKRRLTYRDFLRQYQAIMKPDALLQFKTDNQGLFEYSLVSMNHFGMTFDLVSLNLHHDKRVTDNVPTEDEEKFSADGGRIYELVAHFKH